MNFVWFEQTNSCQLENTIGQKLDIFYNSGKKYDQTLLKRHDHYSVIEQ